MTNSNLPSARITLHLTNSAAKAVRQGHPWVFDQGITKQNKEEAPGALAVLYDAKRKFVGLALYDPNSPIRARVLHRGDPVALDENWLEKRLAETFDQRRSLIDDPTTTGYRLIHGENDQFPGLVLDRYADTLVMKIYTTAWYPYLPALKTLLIKLLDPERIVLRTSRNASNNLEPRATSGIQPHDGLVLYGPELLQDVEFIENGIRFVADCAKGQKTGFFLDQRENRERVEKLSKGKHVLNVFSYNGGFSLYAARGGAKSVISLDLSAPALKAAEHLFALNSGDPMISRANHSTMCVDAFKGLSELAKEKRKFDIVVIDPPSFAKKRTEIEGALKSYRRLTKLGLDVLKIGGILVSASCSARVTADQFFDAILETARATKRPLIELERTRHAIDHPIAFPEGAYLKCIYLKFSN